MHLIDQLIPASLSDSFFSVGSVYETGGGENRKRQASLGHRNNEVIFHSKDLGPEPRINPDKTQDWLVAL